MFLEEVGEGSWATHRGVAATAKARKMKMPKGCTDLRPGGDVIAILAFRVRKWPVCVKNSDCTLKAGRENTRNRPAVRDGETHTIVIPPRERSVNSVPSQSLLASAMRRATRTCARGGKSPTSGKPPAVVVSSPLLDEARQLGWWWATNSRHQTALLSRDGRRTAFSRTSHDRWGRSAEAERRRKPSN